MWLRNIRIIPLLQIQGVKPAIENQTSGHIPRRPRPSKVRFHTTVARSAWKLPWPWICMESWCLKCVETEEKGAVYSGISSSKIQFWQIGGYSQAHHRTHMWRLPNSASKWTARRRAVKIREEASMRCWMHHHRTRARKFKLLMNHNMYNGTRSNHRNTLETFHQNRLESPGIQEQNVPRRAR